MLVVRLVVPRDVDALLTLAAEAHPPLTNLPAWREGIEARIEATCQAIASDVSEPGAQSYMFALEDTSSGRVVGTATLRALAGMGQAYYTYRRETMIHASPGLGLRHEVRVLSLSHEISNSTQLCAMALSAEYAEERMATALLRQARLAFIKLHPDRFSDWCAVAFAGVMDEQGLPLFWESVGRYFFDRDYDEINALAGRGNKSFIAEMMPQLPLYEELLTPEARVVIGLTHGRHQHSYEEMLAEGFKKRRHVDIFDAGPVLTARTERLNTIRMSRALTLVKGTPAQGASDSLVAGGRLDDFRAIFAPAEDDGEGGIRLADFARQHLNATDGARLLSPLAGQDFHEDLHTRGGDTKRNLQTGMNRAGESKA